MDHRRIQAYHLHGEWSGNFDPREQFVDLNKTVSRVVGNVFFANVTQFSLWVTW